MSKEMGGKILSNQRWQLKENLDGTVLRYGHLGALEMQFESAAKCLLITQQTGFPVTLYTTYNIIEYIPQALSNSAATKSFMWHV